VCQGELTCSTYFIFSGPIIFFITPKFVKSIIQIFLKEAIRRSGHFIYNVHNNSHLVAIHFGDYYFIKDGMDKDFEF
jgi:hypothetical protein